MQCPIMVELIKKLDLVRAEQSTTRGDVDEVRKRKHLRLIEAFLGRHERTCAVCRKMNPHGTRFVENARR